MNKLTITKIAAMAMGLAVAGQVAQAQSLFNVDAGNSALYTGAAVLGSSGDIWNGVSGADFGGFTTAISDSTGSFAAGASGITPTRPTTPAARRPTRRP